YRAIDRCSKTNITHIHKTAFGEHSPCSLTNPSPSITPRRCIYYINTISLYGTFVKPLSEKEAWTWILWKNSLITLIAYCTNTQKSVSFALTVKKHKSYSISILNAFLTFNILLFRALALQMQVSTKNAC